MPAPATFAFVAAPLLRVRDPLPERFAGALASVLAPGDGAAWPA